SPRDLIRSPLAPSAYGLPVYVAASPAAPFSTSLGMTADVFIPSSFAVRSLNWQLRLFPRFPTTWNIPKVTETLPLQNACGDAGAVTAAAINRRWFLTIKFFYPIAKLRHKNVKSTGNMPFFPFAGRTHIENLQ